MSPWGPNTYTYSRRVRYGDCDASRNYFTPRAIDYAVEAVEGWCEEALGVSWPDMSRQGEHLLHFLSAGCEFLKPLTAGKTVVAQVEIVGVKNSNFRFRVSGKNDTGELFFRVHLTACFVDPRRFAAIPIPPRYRERFENCQAGCGDAELSVNCPGCQANVEPRSPSLPPAIGSDVPFIIQRRVTYGECGMSGTIYPPRVFDYLLEAVGEWYEKFLGISWIEQNIRKRGQPFLDVTCDFLSPMVAGQLISTIVTVCSLGRASITYSVVGCDEKGRLCFNAQLTACYCTEEEGALKATSFPNDMRKKITAYKEACDRLQCNPA